MQTNQTIAVTGATGLLEVPLVEILEGPLPVRIVRAAQFHEFVEPLLG